MKKVLILGAGVYQVPLIKKAKELGFYTIVASIPGNYPGFQYADKVYYENTTNQTNILSISKSEKIDAILTTGTDVAVKTIGYVCDKLKLSGISSTSAQLVTDKALMKRNMCDKNVRTGIFEKVSTLADAKIAIEKIGFPVMFKCVDKSGSRGIIKVDKLTDVEEAFNYSISYTEQEYIIVEKFISGYEIGVDGYVDNEVKLIAIHNKIMYSTDKTQVPIGHSFPFQGNQEVKQDICEQVKKALDALQLKNCFFNMDIMIENNKAYVIEVGGRTGATCIPELISIHYQCDFYEKMLRSALGEEIIFNNVDTNACIGELIVSEETGNISRLEFTNQNNHPYEGISFDYSVGDSVSKFKVGPDRIGQIIVKDINLEKAKIKLNEMKKNIMLEIK